MEYKIYEEKEEEQYFFKLKILNGEINLFVVDDKGKDNGTNLLKITTEGKLHLCSSFNARVAEDLGLKLTEHGEIELE